MMATEAAVDRAVDAPASEPQLAIQPLDAHNVYPDRSSVNATPSIDDIENKRVTSVDDQIHSADVSTSGGSDTEASRADAKSKDDDKGHGRTGSSVKKPATFKSVSVNRTFLAAKASAGSASATATDKPPTGSSTPPTGSATLSSRPRLVAKTGSSARDSSPRLSAANGGKPGSAPDASAVWNKNRPPPVPEPKKFTDEELKKYGIHMASRLEEEDAAGQNKWADIDDDDEDWAPDAITWGDGTKTTLPHPDEHPTPEPAHAHIHVPASVPGPPSDNGSVASKGRAPEKPRSPAPPISVGSPLAKSSGLASGKGLILKSGSLDKPTLVAKPPAPPAPVKSPWATLPPVEKASPATEHAQLVRGPYKEYSHLKGMTPPPKEIAADDFNRSAWREGSHGNRELYNSHSGRYEPAPDRRGSMRMEQHPRHPSLLLRPPSEYPAAEPSGAFQTNRVSQEVPFGRRRGSSNVSGGSGSFMRMGKGNEGSMPPPELLGAARRTSFAGSVDSPVSPGNLSVSAHGPPRQSGWMPRASPRTAFATPHEAGPPPEAVSGPPPPVLPVVDEVEYQKKLMRERNELARKRRQEEEAREEAERRERIQKKLEALGPAPEKKTDKKESTSKQDDSSQPTHIQQRDASVPSSEAPAQPQQDGDKDAAPSQEETSPETKTTPPSNNTASNRRVSQSQEAKPADLWGAASASRQERFASSTWNAAAQPSSRNVWGSPNNDRGLGNGTFYTDIGRLPTDGSAPAQGKGPSPIAPPGSSRQGSSQGRPQPPPPIGSRVPRYGGAGAAGATGSDLASKWVASVSDNDKKMSAARIAERAERERQLAERGLTIEDAQPAIKETWRPVHAPGDGTRRSSGPPDTQAHRPGTWRGPGDDIAKNPPSRGGIPPGAHDGIIGVGGTNASVPPQDELPSGANAGIIGVGGTNAAPLPTGGNGTGPSSRSSRFFPSRDIRNESSAPVDARSKSPTPPPPTMEGHPVYEGDVMRPHVSLPKPQPIVKLPPAISGSQPSQPRTSFGWANPPPFKDPRGPVSPNRVPLSAGEATQEKWQSRINSLLNGAKSPPQKSIGVDPASKSALDHATHPDSATVSLPRAPRNARPVANQRVLITKPMAEECFEEQEMGSLPQIRLPHKAPEAAWQPALAQTKPLPKRFLIQSAIMEPYYFPAEVVGGGNAMRIQFPGMVEPKIVTVPFSATRGGRGSHTRAGPRHRGTGHERRGGKREASSPRGEHAVLSSSGRGSRGSYRSRGSDNWTRAPATPPSLST